MTLQLRDKNMLCVEPNSNYFSILSGILIPDVDSKFRNNLKLERAVTYHDAIKKVSSKAEDILSNSTEVGKKKIEKDYDIIFCEYELGGGKTAQDLLEKVRKEYLIPLRTIFIMIASERYRSNVMAVLEFAPDAYIIKGNTPDDMEKRIMRAVQDRAELIHIYTAIHNKEYEQALSFCDTYIHAKKMLTPYVMKLRGFVLLELHDYEGAKRAYKQIIELEKAEAMNENRDAKPIPYAQNGLAKSLYYLGEKEEAEGILTTLVKSNPDFMEGYDLLSEIYRETDRPKESQEILEQATVRSPHRFDRQKLLGLTALDNEDLEGAKVAFKKLTNEGKSSNAQHPENFVHLATIHTKEGDTKAADVCLRRVKTEFKESEFADAAKFCAATMEHTIHTQSGDTEKARLALGEAISLHKNANLSGMSERMQVDFACGCIEEGYSDVGANILENALQNSPRKELVTKRAEQKLGDNSKAIATIRAVEKEVQKGMDKEIDAIMELFREGRQDVSKRRIDLLVKENPNNPDIIAKAAHIHFGCIDTKNPQIDLCNSAKKHLGTLIRIRSNHPDKDALVKQSAILDGVIRLIQTRELIQKDGDNPNTIIAAIRAFFLYLNTQTFDEKIFTEASQLLQKIIEKDPEHKDIFFLQSQEERIRSKNGLQPSHVPKVKNPSIPSHDVRITKNTSGVQKKEVPPSLPKEVLPSIDDDAFSDFILK